MTRPPHSERCKRCLVMFVPTVEVESLPVFNSVEKSLWKETNCPKCGFEYRIARLSKNSIEVCLVPAQKVST
ncbi:MAG TPA: hypothetical protein VN739_02295 [Nitrososphaerales archaeon]|nr:hypothetical protein [Nitrososphaerales archaeon]